MKKMLTMTVLLLTTVITGTAAARDFTFTKRTDPMSDADRSSIVKHSTAGSESLMWSCGDNGLNVVFAYRDQTIWTRPNVPTVVAHRFPPFAMQGGWEVMPGRQAAAIETKVDAYRFTADSMDFPKVWLRATDGYGYVLTAEFNLGGLDTALDLLPCAAGQF